MAIIYGNAISIGYATSGSSVGGTYSIWLTLPAVAASTTFTAVKDGVSAESKYISSIGAAKITLPADNPEGDWTITGTVGGKTVSKTVTVKSGTVDYFVDFRNDFIPLVGDLAVGNLVTFDNKSWRVVHQEGTHWYLASENIVSQTQFGSNNVYKGSIIAGVAATYESEQLSETAKEYCADVTVNNVTAKVFVPSYEQVNGGFSYYNSSANRICQLNGAKSHWWTSSPRSSTAYVYYVYTDGMINGSEFSTSRGFRPHICLNINNSGLDFTYTGDYRIRLEDGVIELLSSGEFKSLDDNSIDIFCVGGGGGGGNRSGTSGSSGGGGGYTATRLNNKITANTRIDVTIGNGGANGSNGGTTSFGDILSANGGKGGRTNSTTANGGSAGGDGGTYTGGKGGSDGASTSAGSGQGTTTREFGEATGKLYAGGGGGGCNSTDIADYDVNGGAGSGGKGGGGNGGNYKYPAGAGMANTGGGGGGGQGTNSAKHPNGGSGGSGIVCIRKAKPQSTDIPLTGDLAIGNTVTFDDKSFLVVHNEGTQWYLAKEYITDQTTFSSKTPALYNGSKVASMCNTYLTQFSDNAKKYMVDVTVEGVTNKVFVPTHAQVNGGFSWYNSNANRTVKRDTDKVTMSWWTSTSYNNSNLLYAIEGGQSSSTGSILTKTYDHTLGVRPHICIDTSLSGSASEETVLNGTYLFNANPTAPAKYPFTETVPYKYGSSSGGIYQSIRFYQDTNTKNLCMYYHYSDTTATAVYNFTTKKWLNDTYKTIIFDNQTVSESFYNWIIANTTLSSSATKTISAGRYYFNSVLTTVSSDIDSNVDNNTFNFTLISNNAVRTRITYSTGGILNYYDSNGNKYNTYSASAWNNNIYRDIKLASDQNVPEDFYNWFIANTSKL